jgi:DNA-binding protein H-NS
VSVIDVSKLTFKQLVSLQGKIGSAIAEARLREKAELKKKVAALAGQHGFAINELFGGRGFVRPKGEAKYANPADPNHTWTGRGRRPDWLVAKMKRGAKLEDFAI